MKRYHNILRCVFALALVFALLLSMLSCGLSDLRNLFDGSEGTTTTKRTIPGGEPADGQLSLHFLDVGQGDSIIAVCGGEAMLIDTSYKKKAVTQSIVDYLQNLGITSLKYLVLTHPDADHIGGAPTIINTFDIGAVIMPNAVASTQIFSDTLTAIEDNNVDVIEAFAGSSYSLGSAAFHILAPNSSSYEDTNDYSIVIRMVFGATSVMLTGDAEARSEGEMVAAYDPASLRSDLLKVGHHGSRTSTTPAFLAAVQPTYAVISCGEGNSYGHPHAETVERLQDAGVQVYRTDTDGTIVFVSDGSSISKQDR